MLVLVTEDNIVLNRLYCKALSHSGFETQSAGTLKQAAECLNELAPQVILLDLGLPDGNGLSLLQGLPTAYHDQKPVVVVISGDEQLSPHTRIDQVQHILKKPVTIQTLIEVIRELVAEVATAPVH